MNSAPEQAENQAGVWGFSPEQLHAQFWAAHGIQVVQRATTDVLSEDAQAFLLTETSDFVLFSPAQCSELIGSGAVLFVYVRLHEGQETAYRERIVVGDEDRSIRFERLYHGLPHATRGRLILTSDRYIASLWQLAADTHVVRRRLASIVSRRHRSVMRVMGRFYNRQTADREMLTYLAQLWKNPPSVLKNIKQHSPGIWRHADAVVDPAARFVAPVWIGRGINVAAEDVIVGPTILWDQPPPSKKNHPLIFPANAFTLMTRAPVRSSHRVVAGPFYQHVKRAFDLIFSIVAIAISLPLYPIIFLAIFIEDGRPFFFGHRRETLGGRVFTCLKFRSMRKDAEQIKHQLATFNKADGPQFFMEEDPRLTRVGSVLRKLQLDELPQFFNVLVGQMSIVGPRPSPHSENQFCPAWREARLSVRAGVTGLWQVKRTRENAFDFQEWIRYDIEYVDKISFKMDLWIIWRTIVVIIAALRRLIPPLRPKNEISPTTPDVEIEVNTPQ
jgi:lipopolysaccharide/colanic/teichoic acid biosynthesis glycosyltransferase